MNRSRAIEVVKNLLNKTVENGATEAEAIAAMEKASEIMEKYELETTELELKEEGFEEWRVGDYSPQQAEFNLFNHFADFYEVRMFWYRLPRNRRRTIALFGMTKDIDLAKVAWKMIRATEKGEWDRVKHELHSRAKADWKKGFYYRMGLKYREMSMERLVRRNKQAGQGTSLVVVKNQLVTEEMAQQFPDLTAESVSSMRIKSRYHFDRGQQSAKDVNIDRRIE